MQLSDLDKRAGRERAVAWALAITLNTTLAPKQYEKQLLERFIAGQLSLDEVISCLQEQQEE